VKAAFRNANQNQGDTNVFIADCALSQNLRQKKIAAALLPGDLFFFAFRFLRASEGEIGLHDHPEY